MEATAATTSTSGHALVVASMRLWDAVLVLDDPRRRDAPRLGGCVAGVMERPPLRRRSPARGEKSGAGRER